MKNKETEAKNKQSEEKEAFKGIVLTVILEVVAMLVFYVINR
ncbi:MAG: hypothetical protein ABI863_20495 [Ginsengibacter sp.]